MRDHDPNNANCPCNDPKMYYTCTCPAPSRFKVVCMDCEPAHPNESGATIEQWELSSFTHGFVCVFCGKEFGPFPDFRPMTTYKMLDASKE